MRGIKEVKDLDTLTPNEADYIMFQKADGTYKTGKTLIRDIGKIVETNISGVIAAEGVENFPKVGEEDKIYLDKASSTIYLWDGEDYVTVYEPGLVQTTGTATDVAMSQKATTDAINAAIFTALNISV